MPPCRLHSICKDSRWLLGTCPTCIGSGGCGRHALQSTVFGICTAMYGPVAILAQAIWHVTCRVSGGACIIIEHVR